MVPTASVPGGIPRAARAAATSSLDRGRLNSSSGTPRYTTFVRSGGMRRRRMTKSAVERDTAIAMSVEGASSRSAIFWNHGVSVRFACS